MSHVRRSFVFSCLVTACALLPTSSSRGWSSTTAAAFRARIQRAVEAEDAHFARLKQTQSESRTASRFVPIGQRPAPAADPTLIALTFVAIGGLFLVVAGGFVIPWLVNRGPIQPSIRRRDGGSDSIVLDVTPAPASFFYIAVVSVGALGLSFFLGLIVGLVAGVMAHSAAVGRLVGVVIGPGAIGIYWWFKEWRYVARSEKYRKPVTLRIDTEGLSKDRRVYPIKDIAAFEVSASLSLYNQEWPQADTAIIAGSDWRSMAAASTTQLQTALARGSARFASWARRRQENRSFNVALRTKESNQLEVLAGGLTQACARSLKNDLAQALTEAERPDGIRAFPGGKPGTQRGAGARPGGPSLATRLRVSGLVLAGQVIAVTCGSVVLSLLIYHPGPVVGLVGMAPGPDLGPPSIGAVVQLLAYAGLLAGLPILCSWILARSCGARIRPLVVSIGSCLVAASVLICAGIVMNLRGHLPSAADVFRFLFPLALFAGVLASFFGTYIRPKMQEPAK
jgi:hypothetical protein